MLFYARLFIGPKYCFLGPESVIQLDTKLSIEKAIKKVEDYIDSFGPDSRYHDCIYKIFIGENAIYCKDRRDFDNYIKPYNGNNDLPF